MKSIITTVAAGVCGTLLATSALAVNPNEHNYRKERGAVTQKDRQFLMEAAQAGALEVKLGRIALQTSDNEAVRQYGDMMMVEHSRGIDDLQQLAAKKGVTVPAQDAISTTEKELRSQKGKAFDSRYMELMVRDHEESIARFERAARSSDDEDLRSFAVQTLPTLRHHLKIAQTIQKGTPAGSDEK